LDVGYIEKSNYDSYAKQIQDEYDSYCGSKESAQNQGSNANLGIKAFTFSGGKTMQNTERNEFCKIGSEKIYSEVKAQSAQSNGTNMLEQARLCAQERSKEGTESLWAEVEVLETDDKFTVKMHYQPGSVRREFTLTSIAGSSINCRIGGVDVVNAIVVRSNGSQAFDCEKEIGASTSSILNFQADDKDKTGKTVNIRARSRNVAVEREDAIKREVNRIEEELKASMQQRLDQLSQSLRRDFDALKNDIGKEENLVDAIRTRVNDDGRYRDSCPRGTYLNDIIVTIKDRPERVISVTPKCRSLFRR